MGWPSSLLPEPLPTHSHIHFKVDTILTSTSSLRLFGLVRINSSTHPAFRVPLCFQIVSSSGLYIVLHILVIFYSQICGDLYRCIRTMYFLKCGMLIEVINQRS